MACAILPLVSTFILPITGEEALQNGRRQVMYHYIKSQPGTTFRECCRATSFAPGTVRHHLNVMKRSGLILEVPYRSTLRYFDNRPIFQEFAEPLILLREPDLRTLFETIRDHPNLSQGHLHLQVNERSPTNRSTLQARLAKLIQGGLVSETPRGRSKLYRITTDLTQLNLDETPVHQAIQEIELLERGFGVEVWMGVHTPDAP